MARPWIKLWTEIRHDLKLSDFNAEEFGILVTLFLIAEEIGMDGLIPKSKSKGGYNRKELIEEVGTTQEIFNKLLRKLQSRSICRTLDDRSLLIENYAKRQALKPSDKPEAVAERVRKYRALKRPRNADVTPLDKDKERDKDKDNPSIIPPKGGRKLRYVLQNTITKEKINIRADNPVEAMNQTPWPMDETLVYQRPK